MRYFKEEECTLMQSPRVPNRGRWLGVAALAVAMLGLALGPQRAQALQACFTDPLVTFPNGITVDLHATIGDSLSDVQHVNYVLHGPSTDAGTSYSLVYPDGTAPISSFQYVADGQPHQYYADITITTGTASVAVTAYLDWTAGGKHNTGTAQTTGYAGQAVETPVLSVVCANLCTG
jgi:hypothetical protein